MLFELKSAMITKYIDFHRNLLYNELMVNIDSSWEIETLIRKSFTRLKERLLTYVLAYILMVSLFAILGFAMLFVIIFSATIFAVKVHVITGIIFLLIFILACTAFIYVMAFCQLLIVHTLIRETKGTLMQNIRDVKGHVWEFVWFMIASSLFFIFDDDGAVWLNAC
jgi:hypothetical protein